MGVTPLKTDIAVLEAVDVLAVARRMVAECEAALADGEVSPEEARGILATAREALDEARESVAASEDAYHADRAIDAIRRNVGDYSTYQQGILRQVRLVPLPSNVVQFPVHDNAPATG